MAKKRILHVEDNLQNQRLVRKLLIAKGYEILEAEDGLDGISMALAEQPDLILMDINLPIMDGLEAIAELKKSAVSHIPIIAITANAMRGDRERFLAAGADDYLQKPFTGAELHKVVIHFVGIGEETIVVRPVLEPISAPAAVPVSESTATPAAIAVAAAPLTAPAEAVTALATAPEAVTLAPTLSTVAVEVAADQPALVDQPTASAGVADISDRSQAGC